MTPSMDETGAGIVELTMRDIQYQLALNTLLAIAERTSLVHRAGLGGVISEIHVQAFDALKAIAAMQPEQVPT